MTGSRFFRLFIFLFAATAACAQPQISTAPPLTLTPAVVVAGSPELLRISAPHTTSIDGEWLGRKLQFFPARDHRTWFALAGVDVETPAAPSTLQVHMRLADNTTRDLTDRQRLVLRGVFDGLTNKEIAARLEASETSVKASIQELFTKAGVRTRSQLVRVTLERFASTWLPPQP